MLQETNIPGLLKDSKTNVIINTNIGEYTRIRAARDKLKADREEARRNRNEIMELKETVNNMTQMMAQLVEGLKTRNG